MMSHVDSINEHSPRAALIVLVVVIFGGAVSSSCDRGPAGRN